MSSALRAVAWRTVSGCWRSNPDTLEVAHDGAVNGAHDAGDIVMPDVLGDSEFAGPAPAFQLASHVGRCAVCSGEERDFFETFFERTVAAQLVIQTLECLRER